MKVHKFLKITIMKTRHIIYDQYLKEVPLHYLHQLKRKQIK